MLRPNPFCSLQRGYPGDILAYFAGKSLIAALMIFVRGVVDESCTVRKKPLPNHICSFMAIHTFLAFTKLFLKHVLNEKKRMKKTKDIPF